MAITLDGTNGITSSGDLTLNNGNADGAQVTLASSGYSNWNLDNYSGRFRAYYNATEYFTITNTGNVGIGTSSPTNKLNVVSSGDRPFLVQSGTDTPAVFKSTIANAYIQIGNASYDSYIGAVGANQTFTVNGAERMRIDSSGNVLVGVTASFNGSGTVFQASGSASNQIAAFRNTAASAPYGISVTYSGAAPNGTSSYFIGCYDNSATPTRFEVRSNGGIANYSANNVNLSDERVKTNITPAKSYLDTICAIPVVTFKYKDQTDEELNLGVIAQSVDIVAPELVDHSGFGETPEGESPYLAVYQTDLQYALMKCIQEQQELIKALTSRIETLEAK